jgi:hypothetical protein
MNAPAFLAGFPSLLTDYSCRVPTAPQIALIGTSIHRNRALHAKMYGE